jgi:hypothetical protein
MKVVASFLRTMGIHSRKEPYHVSVRAGIGGANQEVGVSIQSSFGYDTLGKLKR